MNGFEAALPQFEAAGAQVVGVSADHYTTLAAWKKQNGGRQVLLSDFGRKMLPVWGAMETNEQSPIYRYAKRAYFIVDRNGVIRFTKVEENPLDLLEPAEVLQALKASGA